MATTGTTALPAVFVERQPFWRPWWWLILLLLGLGLIFFLVLHRQPAPTGLKLLGLLVFTLLPPAVFVVLCLDTRLDAKGISYRFVPQGWRRVLWADVQRACVRHYAPVEEYGGWGFRWRSSNDYAYNVTGSEGLQLELQDGQRILLGTQQAAALRLALEQLALSPTAR